MTRPKLHEDERLEFRGPPSAGEFAADVRAGLSATPKVLPPKYFYDALGSQLFEAICELSWYPITRAETRLLERAAPEMIAPLGTVAELVELGSGSGDKIARVARALSARGASFDVHLVDISPKALDLGRSALAGIPGVRVVAHRASYEAGLAALGRPPRSARGARLVCFLGSNIGNFDPPDAAALLVAIRGALRAGDGLLLGADLVRHKDLLLVAYDDPLGVTAAFNKNVLWRINKELGGDFDLAAFVHRAVWDPAAARIEMHLVSLRPQRVRIPGAGLEATFAEGESIWTESSYKYTLAGLALMGRQAGLACQRQWVDDEGGFATTLFRVE
jgi:dimethylhistidine N-methyltransferase